MTDTIEFGIGNAEVSSHSSLQPRFALRIHKSFDVRWILVRKPLGYTVYGKIRLYPKDFSSCGTGLRFAAGQTVGHDQGEMREDVVRRQL